MNLKIIQGSGGTAVKKREENLSVRDLKVIYNLNMRRSCPERNDGKPVA